MDTQSILRVGDLKAAHIGNTIRVAGTEGLLQEITQKEGGMTRLVIDNFVVNVSVDAYVVDHGKVEYEVHESDRKAS